MSRHIPVLLRARAQIVPAALSAILLALAGAVAAAPPVAAADARRVVSGWLPNWALDSSVAVSVANADIFTEASPFLYKAIAAGGTSAVTTSVSDDVVANTVNSLHGAGIRVIPSVVDNSAAHAMAALLADPVGRAAHVAQLTALVTTRGFDGIELDYERFAFSDGSSSWAATRPNWVQFVTELAAALHAQGKSLAVAVPPIYSAGQTGAAGYWVYDFASIAGSIDLLRLMTYDYSVTAPGPIAPLSFVRRALDYAVSVVPASKVRLGIPAYGRVWTARKANGSLAISGTCPTSGVPGTRSFTAAQAATFLTSAAGGVTPTFLWDANYGEMTTTFRRTYSGTDGQGKATSCTVTHVAWWVDARGALARMALLDVYGIPAASFWQISGMDADTWPALRAFATGQPIQLPPVGTTTPSPSPSQTVATPAPSPSASTAANSSVALVTAPASVRLGSKVRVVADARFNGQPVAGVRARLYARTAGGHWHRVASATTSASGQAVFKKVRIRRTTSWKVKILPSDTRPPGVGLAATTAVPVVRASLHPRTVTVGKVARLTASVQGVGSGVRVYRQRLVGGQWAVLGSGLTNRAGRVTFRARPLVVGQAYKYRFVTARTAKYGQGVSATFELKVR